MIAGRKGEKHQGDGVQSGERVKTRGLGKRSGELSDSCMHVVVGDGLSVCQSRYFCLFSAALLAARDTPHVNAGCLLSLAKKERGSGVRVCVFAWACVCVRESDREKLEQLS